MKRISGGKMNSVNLPITNLCPRRYGRSFMIILPASFQEKSYMFRMVL
jgi:hypothetical protein